MNNSKIFFISLAILFAFGLVVIAQEVPSEVNQDEVVNPEDLEISEPNLLPDSPLYFLKEWGRGIRGLFAFNPVAKAELKLKFANEKLFEAKKLAEKKKDSKLIEKGLANYQGEVEKIKEASDKIKEKASENARVGSFLDKFIKQQVLHQRILEKLEAQVPPEVFEKIRAAREKHLERFGQVMEKLENKENLQGRLERNLEDLKGSQFKRFKNLEVLMRLEEKVPEAAREAIQKAQENSLKRLKEDLEKISPKDQEKFKDYIEGISGEKKMEILENLRSELIDNPQLREKLLETRENILGKIQEKLEERNCPAWTLPEFGFCKDGRVVIEKSADGCPLEIKCIVPGEFGKPETEKPEVCITLWDPVCGKNARTYSNECFAKAAGVEIDYDGVCRGRVLPGTQ